MHQLRNIDVVKHDIIIIILVINKIYRFKLYMSSLLSMESWMRYESILVDKANAIHLSGAKVTIVCRQ